MPLGLVTRYHVIACRSSLYSLTYGTPGTELIIGLGQQQKQACASTWDEPARRSHSAECLPYDMRFHVWVRQATSLVPCMLCILTACWHMNHVDAQQHLHKYMLPAENTMSSYGQLGRMVKHGNRRGPYLALRDHRAIREDQDRHLALWVERQVLLRPQPAQLLGRRDVNLALQALLVYDVAVLRSLMCVICTGITRNRASEHKAQVNAHPGAMVA